MSLRPPSVPRSCLLFGYCGNQNTGSDVRVLTIIDDLRSAFGPQTRLTVVSQNTERSRGFVAEGNGLTIVEIPFSEPIRFGWRLLKQIGRHDAVVLTEGSALQQNFSSWLLYAFLWAAIAARLCGRRCIAYAVDVGELSRLNRFLTLLACRAMDLIIVRSQRSAERLEAIGFTGRIRVTTDSAFQFLVDEPPAGKPQRERPLVGIAPIDFSLWPVRFRPFGRRDDCYLWPYHFTSTAQTRQRNAELVGTLADLIREFFDERQFDVTLIAMERIDRRVCEQVRSHLTPAHRDRVRVVTSEETGPAAMTRLLRGLDYLIASRYHACILSLGGAVPQLAIAHDDRIGSFYRELGLADEFLLSHAAGQLPVQLRAAFRRLRQRSGEIRRQLPDMNQRFVLRCLENRQILRDWTDERARLSGHSVETREPVVPAR